MFFYSSAWEKWKTIIPLFNFIKAFFDAVPFQKEKTNKSEFIFHHPWANILQKDDKNYSAELFPILLPILPHLL